MVADRNVLDGEEPSVAVFPHLYLGDNLVKIVTEHLAPPGVPKYEPDLRGRRRAPFIQYSQ